MSDRDPPSKQRKPSTVHERATNPREQAPRRPPPARLEPDPDDPQIYRSVD